MSDSARVESGPGLQLLVAAATVADARWRMVFTHAAELSALWQRQLGRETLTQLASLGRFGWVNLLGHVVQAGAGGSVTEVRRVVDDADAADVYAVLLGGDRLELTSVLGRRSREIVGAVATGDTGARTELNRALKSGHTRLEVSTWLLRARPEEARQRCLSVLDALARIDPPEREAGRATSTLLDEVGLDGLLAQVAPRLHYDQIHGPVVLIGSPWVTPIIIEIRLVGTTVIVHPPAGSGSASSPTDALMLIGRALGDEARMRILVELRSGPSTLARLCERLDRPRTSMLHHLALLRGAGLIDLTVPVRGPNVYQLDAEGFRLLATAAQGFLPDPDRS
jgi:DNA-binding transcriptional ArsR family regulator